MSKTPSMSKFKRISIMLLSLAVGVAVVVYNVSTKQPPMRVEIAERQTDVRYFEASPTELAISASGFGVAVPARTWTALSNVSGNVIFRHDDLESGAIVAKGTLVLEIDPAAYNLALAEADAEIASVDADVAQLSQEAENVSALIDLERQRLNLAEQELARAQSLTDSGALSQTGFDAQLKLTLQQRQSVQALVNQQNIFPSQQNRLEAQRNRTLSKRLQVQRDLADTKFFAPFDMRIGEVSVDLDQYVNRSQTLFSADGIALAEVVLQVPITNMRRVISELPKTDGAVNIGAIAAYVQNVGDNQRWPATVIRIANGIDPATRTVRVVLQVEQPETFADVYDQPPLPKGMYVEGVLQIAAMEPQLVIPQSALHQGWVYLVDADNRLERRAVEVGFQQSGIAVINSGLELGDKVILDDIIPAISGSLLVPMLDPEAKAALILSAAGERR